MEAAGRVRYLQPAVQSHPRSTPPLRTRLRTCLRLLLLCASLLVGAGCSKDPTMPPGNDFRIPRPANDTDLASEVIEVLWEKVDFYQDPDTLARTLEGTTPGQRAVYACTWYRSEVDNGGHSQFFYNSTGAIWPEAREGFRLLGAAEHGKILEGALSIFGASPPSRVRSTRIAQLERITGDSPFDSLDTAFYQLEKRNPIERIFTAYILAHPEDFFR